MTSLERAKQYLGIFIGAGDRWEFNVPVDATRTRRGIRLDGIELFPDTEQPGVWWLDDDINPPRRYRAKKEATS